MSDHLDHRHYVRTVQLPSGKTIEVVYFEDQLTDADPATDAVLADLHHCGSCGSDLVYPIEWDEAGPKHWEVVLRCPNCEWSGTGVYEQEIVERFDEELDRGTEALVRELKTVMRANMQDEINRFTRALDSGHILPEDF